ncbi:MAG: anti-sigma factor domain-containing protein [Lachnospiraceae bacterium]|nr:anti-sigma factor domain-containing protein [Lachnospiraceae bacterium]
MKAVVLETKNGYAAVLADDGSVYKIKKDCLVGDEIQITSKDIRNGKSKTIRTITRSAAAILAILVVAGGYYTTSTAASYVTLESDDAQIKLSINYFDRVIDVETTGEDSEAITQDLLDNGVRMEKVTDALEKTTKVMEDRGLIEENTKPAVEIESKNDKNLQRITNQAMESGFERKEQSPEQNPENTNNEAINNSNVPQTNTNNIPVNENNLNNTTLNGNNMNGALENGNNMNNIPTNENNTNAVPGNINNRGGSPGNINAPNNASQMPR